MGILLIDAGNTRIKWALSDVPGAGHAAHAAPVWREYGSVAHAEMDDLPALWRGLAVTRVLISNVAGAIIRERLQQLLQAAFDSNVQPEWFASLAQLAGLRNAYRNPAQLGCDRFAAAIGAHSLFPQQALILASCGTATTIDAISADGLFIGGMILPGLGLMTSALAHGTAQLPLIGGQVVVTAPFADNTADAIISGCIAAQAGAITHAMALQRQHHPEVEIKCILTGGSAEMVAPYLPLPCESINHLVLTGLWYTIALEKN